MTKTFIVAFDGSDQANKALDVAGAIVADDVADIGLPDVMSNRDISVTFRDFAEVEHVSIRRNTFAPSMCATASLRRPRSD